MMNMTAKISFELTKDGKVTIEVIGSEAGVKAGLLTIMERVAAAAGSTTSELLAELSEVAKMREDFERRHSETKDFFEEIEEIFGRLN